MKKFWYWLYLVVGIIALIDFITVINKNTPDNGYDILGMEVSRTVYLIFKITIAILLISGGLRGIFGNRKNQTDLTQ